MIIDYDSKYDEQIKDLFVELQEYVASLDKEGFNIVGNTYREKYFEDTMKTIKEKDGKIMLYEDCGKIVGFVLGIVNNDKTIEYNFNSPKRGRITELVVTKEYRNRGIGKELLNKMSEHLKSIGCKKVLIAVFGYNEKAIQFYKENGYHIRMIDMIEN